MSEIVVTVKLPEGVEAEDVEVTVDPMPAKVEESSVGADALLAALTPSAETKAAYMGEFRFPFSITRPDGDDITFTPNVPWTTIKEIMAAIRVHAGTPAAAAKGERE